MDLKNIKETVCPVCNAETVKEERRNQHTNGFWNEERTFKCGCRIAFSPNFMRIETHLECPNSEENKKKAAIRIKIKKDLGDFIDANQDISSEMAERIKRDIDSAIKWSSL